MSQSKGSSGDGGGGGDDWCTIESDPGVFTEMLETLQVKGVELQELYSLDDDSLSRLGKVYGLIFLFQWIGSQQQEHAANKEPLSEGDIPEDLFFAHQVTTNACATQAILSVLFNAADLQSGSTTASATADSADDSETTTTTSLGSILSEFQSFTQSFPPALKGVAISSSDDIKKIHNSFSRQDAFLQEGKIHIPTGDEEAFHFVAYVPSHGTVYELDGLQKGPIVVGSVNEEQQEEEFKSDSSNDDTSQDQAWLSVARTAIQERMTAGGDHIKFNLMAIVQDKRIPLQQSLKSCSSKDSPEAMALQQQLAEETAKREHWKVENQRRRHNYVPLCIQLFRELAKQGSLAQLVLDAKERNEAKRKAQKAAKAAAASASG